MKRLITIAFFLPAMVFAQEQPPAAPDGEIEDAQVIIEKDREITLPYAQRYFEKIDDQFKPQFEESINLDFTLFDFQPDAFIPGFSTIEFSENDGESASQNEIRLGYGNYQSPLIKATLQSSPNEKYAVGADFNHLSFGTGPVDDENSAASQSSLSLKGQLMGERGNAFGRLAYRTRSGYYYGYDPSLEVDRDTIKQIFNSLAINLGYKGVGGENLDYAISFDGNILNDDFDNGENKFQLRGNLNLNNEGLGGNIDVSAILSQYTNATREVARNLYRVTPRLQYMTDTWSVQAGARLAILDDEVWVGDELEIFPYVNLEFTPSAAFNAFARYSGDIEARFLQDMVDQNFWVSQDLVLNHSLNNVNISAGIHGSNSLWDYKLAFSYKEVDNMAFFVNSSFDPAQFDLIYDPGTTQIINPSFKFGYIGSNTIQSYLNINLFSYTTDVLAGAWHLPEFTVGWNNYFNATDALSFSLMANILGGIEAFDASTATATPLDAIIDLSLGAEYQINKQWLAFAQFNNLLSNEYQLYFNYPNRGIMAKLGVSYSF